MYVVDKYIKDPCARSTPHICFLQYVPQIDRIINGDNFATIFRKKNCFVDGSNMTIRSGDNGEYYFSGPNGDESQTFNKPIQNISNPTIVVGNSAYGGYYHFLYQLWLPLFYLKYSLPDFDSYTVLSPPLPFKYSEELVGLLEVKNQIFTDSNYLYQINDAVFTNISWEGSCPFNPHKPVFDLISEKISTPPFKTPEKIYVARNDTTYSHRKIINEDEVIAAVGNAGYTCVQLNGMPVIDQIATFRNATHIVAHTELG